MNRHIHHIDTMSTFPNSNQLDLVLDAFKSVAYPNETSLFRNEAFRRLESTICETFTNKEMEMFAPDLMSVKVEDRHLPFINLFKKAQVAAIACDRMRILERCERVRKLIERTFESTESEPVEVFKDMFEVLPNVETDSSNYAMIGHVVDLLLEEAIEAYKLGVFHQEANRLLDESINEYQKYQSEHPPKFSYPIG